MFMSNVTLEGYAEQIKVLAEPIRIRMLRLFMETPSELCVCEIAEVLKLSQYQASRHLKALRYLGWVSERKQGRWVFYALPAEPDLFQKVCLEALTHIPDECFEADLKRLSSRDVFRAQGSS